MSYVRSPPKKGSWKGWYTEHNVRTSNGKSRNVVISSYKGNHFGETKRRKKIDCVKCNGSGTYVFDCRKCDGSGRYNCVCNDGVYSVTCKLCNGNGKFKDKGECKGCKGTGQFNSNCKRCKCVGDVKCFKCHGNGTTGRVKCNGCKGSGKYTKYTYG
eukprot:290516_1